MMRIATAEKVPITQRGEPVPSDHPQRYPVWPGLVFLFVVLPLLFAPELARREAVRQLEARINSPVSIGDIDLNPITGQARIWDLVIVGDGSFEPVLRVPALDVTLDRDALYRREIIIHRMTAHGLALHLERIGPTRWNVDQILRSRWEGGRSLGGFTIDQLQVEGGSITMVDRTATPVVRTVLRDLDFTLQPVPLTPEADAGEITGKARLDQGPFQMSGTLHLNPFRSQLKITATQVPIANFHGYIHELVGPVESLAGTLDGHLDVTAALDKEGYLTLKMNGAFEGRNVAFWLPGDQEPVFHAKRLKADSARISVTPTLEVEVPKVQLTGATVRVTRNREGKLNIRQLWPSSSEQSQASSVAPTPLVIRHLVARKSRIEFVDTMLTPSFIGAMSNVTAEIHNTSTKNKRATLKLKGKLGGAAPVALTGYFTPVARPRKVHIEGTVKDYDLSQMSPYAEKYVRHPIRRGRLTTRVKYTYDAGNLEAGNEIRIRQLKIGDPLDDEVDAEAGIPLKLALALLEGLDGEIRLQVPVNGNLDNPKFDFDSLVWEAVRNSMAKAITAPFRLFGQIITVGGTLTEVQVKPVSFAPGSVTPDTKGKRRLHRLVSFMRKRPKVELQLLGQASHREAKALPKKRRRSRVASDKELRKLAADRARFIERTLVRRGIARKRLFVLRGDPEAINKRGTSRVAFSILN